MVYLWPHDKAGALCEVVRDPVKVWARKRDTALCGVTWAAVLVQEYSRATVRRCGGRFGRRVPIRKQHKIIERVGAAQAFMRMGYGRAHGLVIVGLRRIIGP